MFPNKEAMQASIASVDCQIRSFKSSIESLRAQKKIYSYAHGGRLQYCEKHTV